MKTYVKGGAWRNIEDEILKTAVMKYGKNNWPIIASLLPRKSAKQCKARWYDWLDPEIKKVEWTREEDEKLLHLAKIFPTQWRTIAPAVGRTAAQCLERYEQLLDEAQEKDNLDDESNSLLNLRRLKPGEIDPNPENKPAKPDAIDMDEDELEMLSEAKARLSNTMGKKEKRKAREAAMDEERRLADIQRAREMKSAGIYLSTSNKYSSRISNAKKKKHNLKMDVNNEIPFFHRPQPGIYETTFETTQNDSLIIGNTIEEIEGKRNSDIENEKRKEDKRKQALRKKLNLPDHFNRLNRLHEESKFLDKREKLNLPASLVNDSDLENIGKITSKINHINGDTDKFNASKKLLGDYTPIPTPSNIINDSEEGKLSITERLKFQARDLLSLTQSKTPLSGGLSTPFHETFNDFEGVTPMSTNQPNRSLSTPLLSSQFDKTPFHGVHMSLSNAQNSSSNIHRDALGINSNSSSDDLLYYQSILAQLKVSLQNLPEGKNIKSLRVQVKDTPSLDSKSTSLERDASDVVMEEYKSNEEIQIRLKSLLQSTSSKQGLPIPSNLNCNLSSNLTFKSQKFINDLSTKENENLEYLLKSNELIYKEIQKMVNYDLFGNKSGENKRLRLENGIEDISEKYLHQASKELQESITSTISQSDIEFQKKWKDVFLIKEDNRDLNILFENISNECSNLSKTCSSYIDEFTRNEREILNSIHDLGSDYLSSYYQRYTSEKMNEQENTSSNIQYEYLKEKIENQREINLNLQNLHSSLLQEIQQMNQS